MFVTKIKTEAFLVRSGVQLNQLHLRPNQSLKLTEPAVDDLMRAKHPATIGQYLSRADIPSLRRFAAELSSGPLRAKRTFAKLRKIIFVSSAQSSMPRFLSL